MLIRLNRSCTIVMNLINNKVTFKVLCLKLNIRFKVYPTKLELYSIYRYSNLLLLDVLRPKNVFVDVTELSTILKN